MLWLGKEQAGGWISREFRTKACMRFRGPSADSLGDIGLNHRQPFAQLLRVKLRDGEYADAALVAPGPAGEPVAGALRCRSERGIDDREEVSHSAQARGVKVLGGSS